MLRLKPKLIIMLTHHDQTVKNAIQIFDECKNLPAEYWGFKDIGLPKEQMKQLVANIKKAGKTTVLEVVTYTETECLAAAKLALECNFDYLMGTIFYPSVFELLKNKPIKYFPFCGKVSQSPSILEGSVDEIITQANQMRNLGVAGFDLLAYRHVGDPEKLIQRFVTEMNAPVVIAGSIDSFARLDRMKEVQPWGFTIGGAFFNKKFVANGSFGEQITKVLEYLNQ
jgi:hypothetical protein